ncbi:MAG: FkbM family methyltransferase [Roseovarius sp.]|nr:FkbM family methyltransferase [Roseovarius sp.]
MSDELAYELNGVNLPHDEAIITPQVAAALTRGNYERAELLALPKFLEPSDRVLELGAGIGYISSYAAKVIGVAHVTCVEANPKLAAYIRRMHGMQGLINTEVRNCVALPGGAALSPDKTMDFYIREPFWSSSLEPGRDVVAVETVEQAYLPDLIADSGATALIVDIEGGERDLFLGGDLGSVRKIYVELHTRYIRPKGIKACFDALSQHGFYYDQRVSHGGVVLFRKL